MFISVVFHCNTENCNNKCAELIPLDNQDFIIWTCGVCHHIYMTEIYITKEKNEEREAI